MLLGKGGSTDTNSILDARLMECNRIHLTLDDEDFATLGDGLFREVKSVEYRALVKNMRGRGVQVLRESVCENSPSKGHRMTHRIGNREDNPTEKLVACLRDKES